MPRHGCRERSRRDGGSPCGGKTHFSQDVGEVGLVEGGERDTLLAEVVERRAYVGEGCLVDDVEAVWVC